jgi:hypothetical protein
MGDIDMASRTALPKLGFGLGTGDNVLMPTPERRAIERIKRKATGLATAAAAELSAQDGPGPPEDPTPESVHPSLAGKCRCDDADVKAYRDGAEWVCQTCGHELSASASRQLTVRAWMRGSDRSPGTGSATRVQPPIA